jgi:hypothetical protein
MPLNAAGRNALLDSGKAAYTHVGAYTDLGTTESSGGSYARQAITWTAASSGITDNNAQISIPINAGQTIVAVSLHSAVSAGTLYGFFPYGSAGQVVKGVGTVTASTDTVASFAHGLTTDDRIFFAAVSGEALPTGISATTLYWVRSTGLTTDAFTFSTTQGGGAVSITTDGEVAFFKTVPNTFASSGNLVIASGALDLDLNFV